MSPIIFNREDLLKRLGGNEYLLDEMLSLFMKDAPSQVAEVGEAVVAQQVGLISLAVHGLKGSAANIGALGIFKTADALERAAERGEDREFEKLLSQLRTDMADFEAFVGKK